MVAKSSKTNKVARIARTTGSNSEIHWNSLAVILICSQQASSNVGRITIVEYQYFHTLEVYQIFHSWTLVIFDEYATGQHSISQWLHFLQDSFWTATFFILSLSWMYFITSHVIYDHCGNKLQYMSCNLWPLL